MRGFFRAKSWIRPEAQLTYGNRSENRGCMWGQWTLTWKEHERVFWTVESFRILVGIVTSQVSKFTQLNPYNFFFFGISDLLVKINFNYKTKQNKQKKNPKVVIK